MATPPDLTVDYTDIRDESTPQRDGTFLRQRRYVFYLGQHGPFTERVPLENFDETEIKRRVDKVRAHVESLYY